MTMVSEQLYFMLWRYDKIKLYLKSVMCNKRWTLGPSYKAFSRRKIEQGKKDRGELSIKWYMTIWARVINTAD